jgi:hypothetical protein
MKKNLKLLESNFIGYKHYSETMTYTGGQDIFRFGGGGFRKFVSLSGIALSYSVFFVGNV